MQYSKERNEKKSSERHPKQQQQPQNNTKLNKTYYWSPSPPRTFSMSSSSLRIRLILSPNLFTKQGKGQGKEGKKEKMSMGVDYAEICLPSNFFSRSSTLNRSSSFSIWSCLTSSRRPEASLSCSELYSEVPPRAEALKLESLSLVPTPLSHLELPPAVAVKEKAVRRGTQGESREKTHNRLPSKSSA